MFIYIFAAVLFSATNIVSQKSGNYGPYNLVWSVFETCKGPKQKNCGLIQMANKQNISDILFVIDFPKDCPIDMMRVTISTIQNGATKKLWHYSLHDPCQHFVMGAMFAESFNLTSHNCKVKKGNYEVHLNMMEKTTTFLGNNFFYGSYDFKATAYNKINNFVCVHSVIEITKQPK